MGRQYAVFGVPDEDLRQHTGTFPATFRNDKSAHPVYVLRASITGHLVCPCSTRGNPKKQRYIKKGLYFGARR
jgi:hypothetical protein